jgi:hypothetical protein
MKQKNKCICGSLDVVYFVQKGRNKKMTAYCERCLPVEPSEPDISGTLTLDPEQKRQALKT